MATEDLMVQHSASAETAAFDTENRTLILPVWEDMDDSLYDMLVGHEVSHALHTPATGWQDFIGDGPGARMRHMFVNVVEDARIERMIKDKFPGLRRDFASAYKNLHERDLFEIANRTLDTDLPLIDRLNLEFKLGLFGLVDIPFSTDEQSYVTRMAETTTFDEVVQLAKELYEMQVEQDEENAEENQDGQPQASPESGDGEGEGSGSAPSDSDESGESDESGAGSSGDGDEEGDESSGSGDGDDESGEDSGASSDDDTDDGESADSTDSKSSEGGEESSDLEYDDYENNVDCAGSTQNSFEKGVGNLRNEDAKSYNYNTIPSPNLDNIVVDHTTIADLWSNRQATSKRWNDEYQTNARIERQQALNTYQNSIKATVAQMVQHFQMKQAADADKKTQIAKTGVLDPITMINYRWSEDIFMKNEVHADEKNHGMIMYVDWSGSMSGILQDTVEQLLVLVEFCRKVNIPYEVYAFSSNEYCPFDRYSNEYDEWVKTHDTTQWTPDSDTDCQPHSFALYNFLSSRMNKRQYNSALNHLWLLTSSISHYGSSHDHPNCLQLGCTPLNEALVCAMDQVPAFQEANGIQIVNTVVLTDGDGHSMVGGYYGSCKSKTLITDKKTRKTYEVNQNESYGRGETSALLNMLRDRTGTNLVGIRLHDSKNINNLRWQMDESDFQAASQQYKTDNYITLPSAYDKYFLVKGNLKVETDAMENLGDNESYTKIKNAFMKGGNRKKSSRVIASKMVDIFAA